jgi:chromosome segregation ATPase
MNEYLTTELGRIQANLEAAEQDKLRLERAVQDQKRALALLPAAPASADDDDDDDDMCTRTINLTTQLTGMNNIKDELSFMTDQRNRYRRHAAELEGKVAMLEEDIDRLARRARDPAAAAVSDSNAVVASLQREVGLLKEQVEDLEKQKTALVADLQQAVAQATAAKQAASVNQEQQQYISDLEADLNDAERELGEERAKAARDIESLKETLRQLNAVDAQHRAQIDKLQAEVTAATEAARSSASMSMSMTAPQTPMSPRGEVSKLMQTIRLQEAHIEKLKGELQTLKTFTIEYKEQGDARISSANAQLDKEREERRRMAQKLSKIKVVIIKNQHDMTTNPELKALVKALSA